MPHSIEQQDLIKKTVIDATREYCTPLISLTDDFKNPDIGSGTYTILGSKKGILTNAHVAEIFQRKRLNYVRVPRPDTLLELLTFSEIISLPVLPEQPSDIDMSFIVLTDEATDIILQMGKKFWNLDQAALEHYDHYVTNVIWLIHGAVAYKNKLIDGTTRRKVVDYQYAGPYIVSPDMDHIRHETCYYGTKRFSVDSIVCPINTKEKMPKSFNGMSGAALWKVTLNGVDMVEKLFLVGIATKPEPATNVERLICRGPIALYQGFYPFCLGMLYAEKLANPTMARGMELQNVVDTWLKNNGDNKIQ